MKNGFVTEDLDAEQLLTRRGRWQGQWPKSLRAHSPPPHPPPIRRRNQGKKKKTKRTTGPKRRDKARTVSSSHRPRGGGGIRTSPRTGPFAPRNRPNAPPRHSGADAEGGAAPVTAGLRFPSSSPAAAGARDSPRPVRH